MAFTVREFHDLTRLLEKHPEWQAELRRLVLTDEVLDLPRIVAGIGEDLRVLTQRVDTLTQRVDALTVQVQALVEAQRSTERRLDVIDRRLDRLETNVGTLRGSDLERRYRERAGSYFDDLLQGIHVLPSVELAVLLDDAVTQAKMLPEQRKAVLASDIVARGRRRDDGERSYLVVEVSAGLGTDDVQRAAVRAGYLSQIYPSIAAVAGEFVTPEARQLAQELKVWQVVDGHTIPPDKE